MPFYPIHKQLKDQSRNMLRGNFGLWYNKFVPLNNADECRPSANMGERDSENSTVDRYENTYAQIKKNSCEMLSAMLIRKHDALDEFCESFPAGEFTRITIYATLITPLITGIGESHPNEVSMVFDHNMGIPYIPASGVKGIVRFAHTLSLIPQAEAENKIDKLGCFDDEKDWTYVPFMFGTQATRGKVVFLDAYPESLPELHVDIMNPHYGPYYSDERKQTPPADYHQPNPIKFLTVKPATTFVFRAIAKRDYELPEKVETAFTKALTVEGVGAKTSVGYGRFRIDKRTSIDSDTGKAILPLPGQIHAAKAEPPSEETWDDAYVVFNAGSGGVITATKDGKRAEIRGKEKALTVVSETLHKKLFERPRNVPRARVIVRAVGNAFEIVRIEAMPQ